MSCDNMSFAKAASCAAIAAMSLGVTVGLVATSATTQLYAPSAVQTSMVQTSMVQTSMNRPVGVTASTINSARGVRRFDNQVAQASVQDEMLVEQSYQPAPAAPAASWAIAAMLSASAAVGAAVLAMRQKATHTYESICDDPEAVLANAGRMVGVAAVSAAIAGSATAASLTYDELQSLSYLETKGSGLSNTCPIIAAGTNSKLNLKAGKYRIGAMCLEPSSFQVRVPAPDGKTPSEFEKTKLMTRLTYTLDGIRADLTVGGNGSWDIQEIDGIDYAATTVQVAGGERVPFLFTIRNLQAKGDAGQFLGQFNVASYRGATFLDPKGRGAASGYDTAVALPASGDDEKYAKENTKSAAASVGTIAFKVAKVNAQTGEVAGVFESIQPSDTDLGAKAPKDIKASGVWYAKISPA